MKPWGDPMATHGEIRWPPPGTSNGRLRGDSHGRRQNRATRTAGGPTRTRLPRPHAMQRSAKAKHPGRRRRGGYALHHALTEEAPCASSVAVLTPPCWLPDRAAPTSTTPEVPLPAQHRKARARTYLRSHPACEDSPFRRHCPRLKRALARHFPKPAGCKRERDLIAAYAIADADQPSDE